MNSNLKVGEVHPSATSAMEYIKSKLCTPKGPYFVESIASNALSGNRLCEVCMGTLERIQQGVPISDRYLLGLAWLIKDLADGVEDEA